MPVTGSGEIKLRADVNQEINGNNTDSNVSLRALSEDAGESVPDALSEFYGYAACSTPSISTSSSSSITNTSMTIAGNVSSDGGCTVTERGFYFGTSSNYANNTKISLGGTTGSYSSNRTSLNASTTYYATAYAINDGGEARGSTVSASTQQTYSYSTRNFHNQSSSYYIESNATGYATYYTQHDNTNYGYTNHQGSALTSTNYTKVQSGSFKLQEKYRSSVNTNNRSYFYSAASSSSTGGEAKFSTDGLVQPGAFRDFTSDGLSTPTCANHNATGYEYTSAGYISSQVQRNANCSSSYNKTSYVTWYANDSSGYPNYGGS